MKWVRAFLAAAGLSVGIALFLPLFITGGKGWGPMSLPVAGMFGRHLTDAELVDGLVQLPLKLELRKADWRFSVLSVDLQLPRPFVAREDIFRDLFLLSHHFFVHYDNVKKMFVRINDFTAEEGKTKGPLLLAMSAEGDARTKKALAAAQQGQMRADTAEMLLRSHFRLTFTRQWKEKYENPVLR